MDPFVGTRGAGNTTPAAQVPFGFAAPAPDTVGGDTSGYAHGSPVLGFSQTHVSGTGGAGKYGNFRITPEVGARRVRPLPVQVVAERATPGYYTAALANRIRVELTASRLAAYHRYSFRGGKPEWLVLDADSVLQLTPFAQRVTRAVVRSVHGRALAGSATVTGGWGLGRYTLYFVARFDRRPRTLGVTRGRRAAVAGFGDRRSSVGVRVGLSFRSIPVARSHLRQLRGGFGRTRSRAAAEWRRGLGRIDVRGGSSEDRRVFATALYHAQGAPHDLSGDNAWWASAEPHYEDFFTLWDTFRTVNPLLTLIAPGREAAIVRSLLDTARHTGWLPDARIAGNDGVTQVGSSGEAVVADAVLNRLPGIKPSAAYRVLRRDAEITPPQFYAHGRVLGQYKQLGYVPDGQRASVSRTLEYAYEDFTVAEVAAAAGRPHDAQRYLARSRSWRNLWDPTARAVRPRSADGAFAADPGPDYYYGTWTDPYYEGTDQQWSTFVPHDAATLVADLGGDGATVEWLQRLFAGQHGDRNEVTLLAPYLYTHAGRPDLAALEAGRERAAYSTADDGLPGNDDSGTLSAWYVWNAIGLYPNAGEPFFYIGVPLFRESSMRLRHRRRFTVLREGPSAAAVVTGATLNGRPLDRAWLTRAEVARGGTLTLRTAYAWNGWGAANRPPSPASGG